MSEAERIVYFDMDGTMFDFDEAAIADVPHEEHIARRSFYVANDYPAYRQKIEDTYNHPTFFDALKLKPGVIENWQAVYESGRHPVVLSSPLSSNPRSIEGKRESLYRTMVPHFGESIVEEAIFDKNKWKYRGIAMIDDRPGLPRGPEGLDVDPWTQILFGWKDMPEVPLATTAFRLLDWSSPSHLIDMLDVIESQRQ